MFCGRCGTNNEPGVRFCSGCGAPMPGGAGAGSTPPSPSAPRTPGTGKRNRRIGIVAVAAAVVIVLVVLLGGRNSYKSVALKFCNAMADENAKKIVALIPDDVVEAYCDLWSISEEDFVDTVQEEVEGAGEEIQDSKFKIVGAEDYDTDDMESTQEGYRNYCDVTVKEGKTVTIEITNQDGDTNTTDIGVIKVGHTWYIDYLNS